jgi:hypothetical protein
MVASQLSQPVASEIIKEYADVLRLGSLRLNRDLITWDVSAQCTPSMRLAHFRLVLDEALEDVPEMQDLPEQVRSEGIVYWICKALSINYGLAEVLRLIASKVGVDCSIESYSEGGSSQPVEYTVRVEPGPSLRVGVSWGGRGNLVSYDRRTAEKRVQGTLSRVETKFYLPPKPGFLPEYHIEMELCEKNRVVPRFFPLVPCGSEVDIRGDLSFESFLVATPLRRTLERNTAVSFRPCVTRGSARLPTPRIRAKTADSDGFALSPREYSF